MDLGLPIFLLIVVFYAVVAVWLGRRSITMPMFFLAVGALTGANGLGWFNISTTSEDVKILIEVTLALLLFADSSTLDLHQLKVDARLPARLIVLALPLVIFLGGLLAFALFPQEGIGFALLMGAILAPTDAALGLPIFTNERVPVRIRRALNVESGLNDGVATPFVTLFTALAVAEVTQKFAGWFTSALLDIAIAFAVGAALGMLGGWLLAIALQRGLTSRASEQIGTLAGTGYLFRFGRTGWKWLYRCFCGWLVLQLHYTPPATPDHGIHRCNRHGALTFRLDDFRLHFGHSPYYSLQSAGAVLCHSQPDTDPHAASGAFTHWDAFPPRYAAPHGLARPSRLGFGRVHPHCL